MKPVGFFVESKSYWCPNCGTHLEHRHEGDEWTLYHGAIVGQEFCPNWGKSFYIPLAQLDEKVSATEINVAKKEQ